MRKLITWRTECANITFEKDGNYERWTAVRGFWDGTKKKLEPVGAAS